MKRPLSSRRGAAILFFLALGSAPIFAESFDSLNAKAQIASKAGQTQEALSDFSQALKLWTRADGVKPRAQALSGKADIEESLGEIDPAAYDLAAATALDKKNPGYDYRLGQLYMKESRTPLAISAFYKAVALNANYKEAYFARAQAYALEGNKDFARQDYKKACKMGVRAACDVLDVTAPLRRRRKIKRETFSSCRASLDACVNGGGSFSQCVKKSRPCSPGLHETCCPDACLARFQDLLDVKSEAEAYRETFGVPHPACAGIP